MTGFLRTPAALPSCRDRRRDAASGLALVLFFLFSEPIPFGPRLGDAPAFFSVNAFLPTSTRQWPMALLAVPAAIALAVALVPLRRRPWDGPCFLLFLAVVPFYVLVWRSGDPLASWYLWLLLVLPWAGLNLWVRSIDYFYASCIAAPLWDMGAALFGLTRGMRFVPEPYAPAVPPTLSVAIDLALMALFATLWRRRVDWGLVLGIERLRAVEKPALAPSHLRHDSTPQVGGATRRRDE